MAQDTFWSDRLHICLSDSMESSIEGPYQILNALVIELKSLGYQIERIEESNRGTKNINSRREAVINSGANSKLLQQVESFLVNNGVRLTKHETVTDPDHFDLSYDLNNISVWKSRA